MPHARPFPFYSQKDARIGRDTTGNRTRERMRGKETQKRRGGQDLYGRQILRNFVF